MMPRLRGLLILVVGLLVARWQIWEPLHAAQLGMQSVTVWSWGVFAAVALPWLGLAYLIFGSRVDRHLLLFNMMDRNNLSKRDVTFLLLGSVPVMILWVVIDQSLRAAGYH